MLSMTQTGRIWPQKEKGAADLGPGGSAKERLVYKGRVISVWRRVQRLPNGRSARLDIVEHPGAVVIVPFLSPQRLVFLWQYRPALGAYLLELPAGTLEKGEAAPACARRELREETGFSCRTLKRIGAIFPVPGYSTEKIILFKATALFPSPAQGDPDEIVERRVLTAGEVKRSFRQGRIRDAKTIAGLAWCRLL